MTFNYAIPESGLDMFELIDLLEKQLLADALKRTNNNKAQAAKLLGINRTTFIMKLKVKGLYKPRELL